MYSTSTDEMTTIVSGTSVTLPSGFVGTVAPYPPTSDGEVWVTYQDTAGFLTEATFAPCELRAADCAAPCHADYLAACVENGRDLANPPDAPKDEPARNFWYEGGQQYPLAV